MAAANEKRTLMDELFKEQVRPTLFLSSRAKVKTTLATEIEFDVVRGTEEYAVDITPGAGSRSNKKSKFTTKTFVPPTYNESYPFTAVELEKRLPGFNKYAMSSVSYGASLVSMLSGKQADLKDKILRSIELQARDAYFDGVITLSDGTTVDYNKKTTHDIKPGVKWNNAAGTPLTNIAAACALCRSDGKIGANEFDLIVADNVLQALLSNPQFVDNADVRRIDRAKISGPSAINEAGATYHGTFSAGSYVINLWAYPQVYTVPVGYGFANEGTNQPYIPGAKALLIPTVLDLRLWFGGVATITDQVDPALESLGIMGGSMPSIVEADFVPYGYIDKRKKSLEVGVESRPLFVPVQIDGFCTFNTLV